MLQLGVGGAGTALGVRRTLAAIVNSRMGTRALLAGTTPRVRGRRPQHPPPEPLSTAIPTLSHTRLLLV